MKRVRHQAIVELVKSGTIASQDDLMRGLQSRRIDVSQSTLSRDIQELGLAKAGGFYVVVESETTRTSEGALLRIVQEFVTGIDLAYNLVIIKTGSGNASTVSQALDETNLPEAIGSLAGENTIFIATKSTRDARKLEKRLRDLL